MDLALEKRVYLIELKSQHVQNCLEFHQNEKSRTREATSVGEMMKILESHLNIQLEGMSLDDDARVQLGD